MTQEQYDYSGTDGGEGAAWVPQERAPRLVSPAAEPNGYAVAPLGLPVRAVTVQLTGDYAHFWVRLRLNPRRSTVDALRSGDLPTMCGAMARLVIGWNLTDEEAVPIPISGAEILDLPDDLAGQIIGAWNAEVVRATEVPKEPSAPSATT